MAEAVQGAMKDIQAEAARKEYNATLQVLRTGETDARIQTAMRVSSLTRSQGLSRDIDHTGQYIDAVHKDAVSGLGDLIGAAESKDGTGVLRNLGMRIFSLDNPVMTRDVVREVFKLADGSTGNKAAQAGAKAWLDTIEGLRVRFNAAGGDVGKLAYGYLAQAHDAARVGAAGAKGWADKVLPLLDRNQYVTLEGRLMDDVQVRRLLEAAHETLATGGQNKTEPGQRSGTGARANRGSDSRVLHFRDGDAWMAYMDEFGQGSLYDAMTGHVGHMARDIGLVEKYGPNPEQQFRLQADIAKRADDVDTWTSVANQRLKTVTPEAYWNVVSGKASAPESVLISQTFQDLRNIQVAAKLGGATLSSMTDMVTVAMALHYNKLPMFDMVRSVGKQFDADTRDFLQAHGVIGEAMTSTLNRWTGDNMTHSLTGRLAGSVMKLSLMNAWTDGLRNAYQMTMMGGMAKMAGKKWGDLTAWDRHLLERKGVTEGDWAIVNMATATDHQGRGYLTPESINAITDADVQRAAPDSFKAITDRISEQTKALSDRNAQEAQWIKGRIDKFDQARNALNRQVKAKHAGRQAKNEQATGPMLQRMALLDAQREAAQLQSDIETDFNRYATQDEVRAFLNAVEDGASADLTDVGPARREVRRGLEAAEAAGRRFGEAKGRLERRMQEIENRIVEMDRQAGRETNADAKAAAKKADEMRAELQEFIDRSTQRQTARQQVIDRMMQHEGPALQAEALRLRQQVSTKILAAIVDESQFAVVNPDVATRAIVTGGGRPTGTIDGELWRSFAQFKSFPTAMVTRILGRIIETPQGLEGAPAGFGAKSAAGSVGNTIGVIAGMNLALMLVGGLVLQAKTLVQGKDPFDMTQEKFWLRALAQGGGLGYLGDLIFKDPTEQRGNSWEQRTGVMLGPVAGSVMGLVGDLGIQNAWEAAKDKPTHAGAEALRWVNSQAPYQSLWWLRGLYERSFLYQAQEAVNPGYLARMRQRAMVDWNQGYWWDPAEVVPSRAPDLSNAVGN